MITAIHLSVGIANLQELGLKLIGVVLAWPANDGAKILTQVPQFWSFVLSGHLVASHGSLRFLQLLFRLK